MKRAQGFSLVELLAVVAVGTLLASVLATVRQKNLGNAGMAATASNGVGIYQVAFAMHTEELFDLPLPWPGEGDFASTTDLFKYLVTNDWLCVSYDFFAAPGIPAAHSNDPDDFKAENNAWKLVLGLDGARDGTPCLFTRNYAISAVPTGEGPILPEQLMDNGGKPFGTAGLVVIKKGGEGLRLQKNNLREELFNPAGAPPDGRILAVLDP